MNLAENFVIPEALLAIENCWSRRWVNLSHGQWNKK